MIQNYNKLPKTIPRSNFTKLPIKRMIAEAGIFHVKTNS